jgi:hypothetical protein
MEEKELQKIADEAFNIKTPESFNELALELFSLQFALNPVYRQFCNGINRSPLQVSRIEDIPYLPIELFRTCRVASTDAGEKLLFHSSGTQSDHPSSHYIFRTDIYERSILEGFQRVYGDPADYRFMMLTPDPHDRPDSSLAYMANVLVGLGREGSGFYLGREKELVEALRAPKAGKTMLLGLSFALADLVKDPLPLDPATIVVETGGMKGRRRELPRAELHEMLCAGFQLGTIHSEYSMCELFSQAWSVKEGVFACPPWMRMLIRDTQDPLDVTSTAKAGGLNCIDLANAFTCSFIATGDYGKIHADGTFEVMGRLQNADLKGCVLMLDE